MTKDELSAWALANGWQMLAGFPSLTKPSAPSVAIVRLVLKTTVASLEIKKPAGKWEKVSGAAYLFRRDRVLHHGTLLCRARLDDLHGVLGPTGTLVEWVGVASRPASVANLGIDPDQAAGALVQEFLPPGTLVGDGQGCPEFETRVTARAESMAAANWLWDQTPLFTWEGPTLLGTLRARVKDGQIEAAWDDRSLNMSKMVGRRFFDPELFEYIPTREVP